MASITGGLLSLQQTGSNVVQNTSNTGPRLSLASLTDVHTTITGGSGTGKTSGDTIIGQGQVGVTTKGASGFDTVNTPHQGNAGFAGDKQSGTEKILATQTHHNGSTVLHLPDGSTITLVGVVHAHASFFH